MHPITSDIGRARQNVYGSKGLVAAIIAQAAIDALGQNEQMRHDALEYFHSAWYQEHLAWLGLDRTLLPEGVNLCPD